MNETPSTPQNPEQLDPFYDTEKVASTTECTGLSPAAVLSEEEAESYAELYAVHRQKPVKNEEEYTHGGKFAADKRKNH